MVKQTRPYIIVIMILIGVFVLSACKGNEELVPTPFIGGEEDAFIGVPNPASFYCQEMGYELDLRDTDGGTEGICVMPNGAECEEWEFLAGGCSIEWTFCQRQGYNIREGEEGAICTFNDGSSCLEYEFFIGECQPPE
jgi:putative hemolysin